MRGIAKEFEDVDVVWIGFQDKKNKIVNFAGKHGIEPVGFDSDCRVSKQLDINYGAGLLLVDHDGTMAAFLDRGFNRNQVLDEIQKMM